MKVSIIAMLILVSAFPLFAKWNALDSYSALGRCVTITYIEPVNHSRLIIKNVNGELSAFITDRNGITVDTVNPLEVIASLKENDFKISGQFTVPRKGFDSVFSQYADLFIAIR